MLRLLQHIFLCVCVCVYNNEYYKLVCTLCHMDASIHNYTRCYGRWNQFIYRTRIRVNVCISVCGFAYIFLPLISNCCIHSKYDQRAAAAVCSQHTSYTIENTHHTNTRLPTTVHRKTSIFSCSQQ